MPPKTETKKTEVKKEAPKTEKKVEAPKKDAPKKDAPKTETKKAEPKKDAPKKEAPKKVEAPKTEAPKAEVKKEAPKKKPAKKTTDENKHKFVVNTEKLESLKKASKDVRTGGKGTVRRTHKVIRQSSGADDAKLQAVLKKQNIRPIDAESVNFIMDDESVLQFSKPKLQASVQANTFVVSGKYEKKSYQDALPGLLGMDLNKMGASGEDDIPELESFEQK